MKTIELKKALKQYIEIGDSQFLDTMYETATAYMEQKRQERMLEEGEEDIKNKRTFSIEEAKKMLSD